MAGTAGMAGVANGGDSGDSYRLLRRDGRFNIVPARGRYAQVSDTYHSLLRLSRGRFLLLLVCGYLLTNLAFGSIYFLLGAGALNGVSTTSEVARFLDSFFFSVQTLATIGYGRITPAGLAANVLVTAEAFVGLLGLALATGLLFARFARPTARVVFADKAIIAVHDGVPSLLFRMANERLNQIVEAQVSVVLSKDEVTAEGESYRNFYDLELERKRSPIFTLSWTVVHPITPASPLYGMDDRKLREVYAEIITSLTGIDDTFSQTIHARYSYTPAEIVWNRAYRDILSETPEGLIKLDIEKIHDLQGAAGHA